MNNQDDRIFDLYKPFRNQLRNFELEECLYLIWGYARNFTFNLPFPDDIQQPGGFRSNGTINDRRSTGIPEFEQSFLLKEMLLNAGPVKNPKYSLKDKDQQAKLVNYMRHTLAEKAEQRFSEHTDVILNFNRLFHRQFQWQHGFNKNIIYRYYSIFSFAEIDQMINDVYNLNAFQLFLLGFYFFRLSAENFKTQLPYLSHTPVISDQMIERFFQLFSIVPEDAKKQIAEHQQMNENLFYSYNPMFARPILRYPDRFICPIPILLFWQITSGTYYAIINRPGFNKAFGNAFETYIGNVINKFNNGRFQVYSEYTYGNPERRSVDWLVSDDRAVLFLECKTKRMTQPAKTFVGLSDALSADLRTMAGFVVQVYKTYFDYAAGTYGFIAFDPAKWFVPVVLTLEPWYFEYNISMRDILKGYVTELFHEQGFDPELMETNPYTIISCQEFELDFQVIASIGIHEYFSKRFAGKAFEEVENFHYENLISEEEFTHTFLSPFAPAP